MSDDADAKLLQVLVRQARENRLVYVILAERSLILSKAKAPQPNHDVHDDAPKRRNGYVLERVGLTLQRQIILLLLAKIHIPLQQHGDVCDQGERETDPVC
jgi:hypothetical protein